MRLSQITTAIVSLAACAVLSVTVGTAAAAPGDLDPSFSNDGLAELEFGEFDATGYRAVAASITPIDIQPSGKLILAGYTSYEDACYGHIGCTYDGRATLARLDPDGSLDSSFAGGGTLESDFGLPHYVDLGSAVLQPDGRILLASGAADELFVARLTADGALDPSFAANGVATIQVPNVNYVTDAALAVQGDGRVVAAAFSSLNSVSTQHAVDLLRLNDDGSLDQSFGTDGFERRPYGFYAVLGSVRADETDRIYVSAGEAFPVPGDFNAAAIFSRFDADGTLDTSFGEAGSTRVELGSLPLPGEPPMALDANAGLYSLLAVDEVLPDPPSDAYWRRSILRLDQDGKRDQSYGPGGLRAVADRPVGAQLNGLATQADGKLLVAGASDRELLLGRRLVAGNPDPGFAAAGWAQDTSVIAGLGASDPLVLADGRIVLAAGSNKGPCAVVARYLRDSTPVGAVRSDPVPCSDPCKPIHGCPLYARRLTLRGIGKRVVRGKLTSVERRCIVDAQVEIFRSTEGIDVRIGKDARLSVTRGGARRYRVNLGKRGKGRKVYAKVAASFDPGFGRCDRARSRIVRLER